MKSAGNIALLRDQVATVSQKTLYVVPVSTNWRSVSKGSKRILSKFNEQLSLE